MATIQRGNQFKVGGAPLTVTVGANEYTVVDGSWKPTPLAEDARLRNANGETINRSTWDPGKSLSFDAALPADINFADLPKIGDVVEVAAGDWAGNYYVESAAMSEFGGKPVIASITMEKRDSVDYGA